MRNASLKWRLVLLVAAALAGLALLGGAEIVSMRGRLIDDRKESLQSASQVVMSLVRDVQAREQKGELSRDDAQKIARDLVRAIRFQGSEYFYIYDSKAIGVVHPVHPEYEGKSHWDRKDKAGVYTVRALIEAATSKVGFTETFTTRPGGTEQVPKLQYVQYFEPWDWAIGTGLYTDDLDAVFMQMARRVIIVILLVTLVVAGVAWWIARAIIKDIGGEPAEARRTMQAVASGDLTVTLAGAPADSLLGELEQLVKALRGMLAQIANGSEQVAASATQIDSTSSRIAEAAVQQNEATQAMAAAMEELTVSIGHVSGNAVETERHADAAAELAGEGEAQVSTAAGQMSEMASTVGAAADRVRQLAENAGSVAQMAAAIKDIANQTNLLALNAAIEAARAGDSGRGFAVVADEVRDLAQRTEKVTREITEVVNRIREETTDAAQAMETILPTADRACGSAAHAVSLLRQIAEGSRSAQHLVREVAASTREQSVASASLASQVERIAQQVEQTSEEMEQAARGVRALQAIAHELTAATTRFRC